MAACFVTRYLMINFKAMNTFEITHQPYTVMLVRNFFDPSLLNTIFLHSTPERESSFLSITKRALPPNLMSRLAHTSQFAKVDLAK